MSARKGLRLLGLLLAAAWAGSLLAADGDVAFKRQEGKEQSTPPAVFPHWSHRIRYSCYACHPSIFEMTPPLGTGAAGTAAPQGAGPSGNVPSGGVKPATEPITMDSIMAGKHCGVCHNGKTAWAVSFETCTRCHAAKQ